MLSGTPADVERFLMIFGDFPKVCLNASCQVGPFERLRLNMPRRLSPAPSPWHSDSIAIAENTAGSAFRRNGCTLPYDGNREWGLFMEVVGVRADLAIHSALPGLSVRHVGLLWTARLCSESN